MDTSTREAALLALDDVFTVTNEFINVMQALCPTTGYHEIPITTASASTTGTSRLSASGANTAILHQAAPHCLAYPQSLPGSSHQPTTTIEGPREPDISSPIIQPFPRLDEATALLFLSCHCRLAEIYESLFQAIRRCIEGPHRTTSHPPAGIILPQLQVGGFGGVSRPALRVDFGGPRCRRLRSMDASKRGDAGRGHSDLAVANNVFEPYNAETGSSAGGGREPSR
ncbi:hypothetical protein EKO27_g11091 [Xylaria grammica]|uniref:Aflatoxin regulatory protein domain-containing protein n=1 Tax=Xylaria grammica TaxID=363999 RepID=A0A439CPE3_9PEZI|nr:hypothetical protein EKO27_g11091 [Xylaria grammica]